MNSPTWTVLTPPWDHFKPTAFYSHAKVKIRLRQSTYIQWNTMLIQMPLPEIMHQPWEWQPSLIGMEADWDQQAPDFKSKLHQTSLSPHLAWRELVMLSSSKKTWTPLCSGREKHILVHFNNPEGRTDLLGTTATETCCCLAGKGIIKLFSRSFNVFCRFY